MDRTAWIPPYRGNRNRDPKMIGWLLDMAISSLSLDNTTTMMTIIWSLIGGYPSQNWKLLNVKKLIMDPNKVTHNQTFWQMETMIIITSLINYPANLKWGLETKKTIGHHVWVNLQELSLHNRCWKYCLDTSQKSPRLLRYGFTQLMFFPQTCFLFSSDCWKTRSSRFLLPFENQTCSVGKSYMIL
jgi:hypothetical protein